MSGAGCLPCWTPPIQPSTSLFYSQRGTEGLRNSSEVTRSILRLRAKVSGFGYLAWVTPKRYYAVPAPHTHTHARTHTHAHREDSLQSPSPLWHRPFFLSAKSFLEPVSTRVISPLVNRKNKTTFSRWAPSQLPRLLFPVWCSSAITLLAFSLNRLQLPRPPELLSSGSPVTPTSLHTGVLLDAPSSRGFQEAFLVSPFTWHLTSNSSTTPTPRFCLQSLPGADRFPHLRCPTPAGTTVVPEGGLAKEASPLVPRARPRCSSLFTRCRPGVPISQRLSSCSGPSRAAPRPGPLRGPPFCCPGSFSELSPRLLPPPSRLGRGHPHPLTTTGQSSCLRSPGLCSFYQSTNQLLTHHAAQ